MLKQAQWQSQDLSAVAGSWQERIDRLTILAAQVSNKSSSRYDETVRQSRETLKDIRQRLSRSQTMAPQEWIRERTAVVAGFKRLQQEYNGALADWSQQ